MATLHQYFSLPRDSNRASCTKNVALSKNQFVLQQRSYRKADHAVVRLAVQKIAACNSTLRSNVAQFHIPQHCNYLDMRSVIELKCYRIKNLLFSFFLPFFLPPFVPTFLPSLIPSFYLSLRLSFFFLLSFLLSFLPSVLLFLLNSIPYLIPSFFSYLIPFII